MQRVLAFAASHLDEDLSLRGLAAEAGLSPFQFHRTFSTTMGETPKHLTRRLRLGRAAVLLLTTADSVLNVALSCGFRNHEVFSRAFRRRFGLTPRAYRERGFAQFVNPSQARDHAALVDAVAPCIGLYYSNKVSERNEMTYSITKKQHAPEPVLVVRRRVKRSDIASAIAGALPQVFAYAQTHGIALAGLPFTRYVEMGPGLITMEPGMRVASGASTPIASAPTQASAGAEVFADTLPGGPVASTVHAGPYEQLSDAYAAIQQWIESQGLTAAGAPWESYLTDPAEHPDPADWKTEVLWPVAAAL